MQVVVITDAVPVEAVISQPINRHIQNISAYGIAILVLCLAISVLLVLITANII